MHQSSVIAGSSKLFTALLKLQKSWTLFCNVQQTQCLFTNIVMHMPNTVDLNCTFKGNPKTGWNVQCLKLHLENLKVWTVPALHLITACANVGFFACCHFLCFPYFIYPSDLVVWSRRKATPSLPHLLLIKRWLWVLWPRGSLHLYLCS